jgi:hypothetical protein
LAVNNLPPIPQDEIKENPRWREWFRNLGSYIQAAQVGNTVWTILQGGTGANNAQGARQNLGLGSMAVENSSTVSITGGTISGVNLTGSSIPYTNVTGLGTIVTENKGTTGSFLSGDTTPKTITVVNGIITSIV